MANTIPGGAYQNAAGAWTNAKGEELSENQVRAAQRLYGAQQAQRAEAEQQRLLVEAQQNPAARAIAMLMPQPITSPPPSADTPDGGKTKASK